MTARELILAGKSPEGLKADTLDLSGCTGLTALPDGLKANYLYLSGCTGLTARSVEEWCRIYGVVICNGVVVLYKAVDENFRSPKGGIYVPGTIPIADDWDGGVKECGGGLHFCARTLLSRTFFNEATKFVACPVRIEDIAIHPQAEFPHKVKARCCCGPVVEVDENMKEIS